MLNLKKKLQETPRADKIKFIVLAVIVLLTLTVAVILTPKIVALKDQAVRDALKEQILSFGVGGWLLFLLLQIFQIIFAVIPGEPIEVLAGVLYGPWGGLFTCLLGCLLGTALVYYLVRWLGYSFISHMINIRETNKFRFLQNARRLDVIVFILFFIPGTPKDVLTYIMPMFPIKPLHFFVLATVARIPSIITSTFAGSAISNGNWVLTVVLFAATGAVALVGILLNDKIIGFFARKTKEEETAENALPSEKPEN